MWMNEQCLVVAFLESSILEESEIGGPLEGVPEPVEWGKRETPGWLMDISPEDLAAEMLEFMKKEFPDQGWRYIQMSSRMFLQQKGVEAYGLPADINMKVEKALYLAQREAQKEYEEASRSRLQQEKEELTSLVEMCVDWARVHGLKRVTVADVDALILEKNLDIMSETKRALYSLANVKLKSSK